MSIDPSAYPSIIIPVAASAFSCAGAVIAALLVYRSRYTTDVETSFTALQDRVVTQMQADLVALREQVAAMRHDLVIAELAEDRWRELARASEDRDRECRRKLGELEVIVGALHARIDHLEQRPGQ